MLQPGDRLVAVDGVRGDAAELRAADRQHTLRRATQTDGLHGGTPGEAHRRARRRDAEPSRSRPTYDAEAKRPLLGFAFGVRQRERSAPGTAARRVGRPACGGVTKATVSAIGKLFYDSEARKEVSGVVGSYEATRQTIELDAASTRCRSSR